MSELPHDRVVTVPHVDASEKLIHFARWQDVEPILDHNKELANSGGYQSDMWRWVGCIPNVIIERWLNEEYERGNVNIRWASKEFEGVIMRKLRDPDWKHLLVGKL